MKLSQLDTRLPFIVTGLIGLFFILVLHFRISYSLIPMLLSVVGLGLLYPTLKQRTWKLESSDKWLILTVFCYFLLFAISIFLHQGKGRELDLPSKMLLMLPLLVVCAKLPLKQIWILRAIVVATVIAGIVALLQYFIFQLPHLFPAHMYIQGGDIVMSLSLFCLVIAGYFKQLSRFWFGLALVAAGFGIIACLLNQARGAWLAAPLAFIAIFYFYRHLLSKALIIVLVIIGVVGALVGGNIVQKRLQQAEQEISAYFEENNGSTSVGARLDMWKSSVIGIVEKPLFGRGLEGIKEMRKQHVEQKLISEFAGSFVHAHNQYLHDAGSRGMIGLVALLALFFVPFRFFYRGLKQSERNSTEYLWGVLGIVHILAVMGYCLTQAFLSHNSGIIFYGFCTLLFYALQKSAQNRPLVGAG